MPIAVPPSTRWLADLTQLREPRAFVAEVADWARGLEIGKMEPRHEPRHAVRGLGFERVIRGHRGFLFSHCVYHGSVIRATCPDQLPIHQATPYAAPTAAADKPIKRDAALTAAMNSGMAKMSLIISTEPHFLHYKNEAHETKASTDDVNDSADC